MKNVKDGKRWTPDELQEVNRVQQQYGALQAPDEVIKELAKKLGRSSNTTYWKLLEARKQIMAKSVQRDDVSFENAIPTIVNSNGNGQHQVNGEKKLNLGKVKSISFEDGNLIITLI